MKKFRSGFVSLIGRPNVGKSTLMNCLVGEKIAITSHKPQTTRNKITTILTKDDFQCVFLDTPGIHKAKSKLGEYMVRSAETTFNEVDLVLMLIEPTTEVGPQDQYVLERIKNVKTPVVLVINKIDTVERDTLLEVITTYSKLHNFAEIVPISAMKDRNTPLKDDLCSYWQKQASLGLSLGSEDNSPAEVQAARRNMKPGSPSSSMSNLSSW